MKKLGCVEIVCPTFSFLYVFIGVRNRKIDSKVIKTKKILIFLISTKNKRPAITITKSNNI